MATIKSYTDLSQSKKLAKILPIGSADMYYMETSYNDYTIGVLQRIERDMLLKQAEYYKMFPCWSLAVLIEKIPEIIDFEDDENDYALEILKEGDLYYLSYGNPLDGDKLNIEPQENFVDACVAMIEKLHKLNLL